MTQDEAVRYFGRIDNFLGMVAAVQRAGHSSPAEELVYVRPAEPMFVVDYTCWAARAPGWEEARGRIREAAEALGLYRKCAEAHDAVLFEALPEDITGLKRFLGPLAARNLS